MRLPVRPPAPRPGLADHSGRDAPWQLKIVGKFANKFAGAADTKLIGINSGAVRVGSLSHAWEHTNLSPITCYPGQLHSEGATVRSADCATQARVVPESLSFFGPIGSLVMRNHSRAWNSNEFGPEIGDRHVPRHFVVFRRAHEKQYSAADESRPSLVASGR
jgi:hypothetical protein